jgi:hypothetical protein
MDGDGDDAEKVSAVFEGATYQDVDFDVVVEATSGTRSSTAGDINLLDSLLNAGAIDAKGYVDAYPRDAISNRSELLKAIEEKEVGIVATMQQQIAMYEQQLNAAQAKLKEQEASFDKVVGLIEENSRLYQFIADLYAESRAKITMANQQIDAANNQILSDAAKINEVTEDATAFAQHIAETEGVPAE